MPFGVKTDIAGKKVKFDDIYERLISKAVEAADLEPVRCDRLDEGGFIHRKMIEYIWTADVAVVDISLLNANVFYELGIRHALHKFVTVLVRRKGTNLPFNIANLNVIEYDETNQASIRQAKAKIVKFIKSGLQTRKTDSLVHEVLNLPIGDRPKRLTRCDVFEYKFRKPVGKSICLITGDIQNIQGIDIWVNTENTNMQMARYYDWSISGVIRHLGAKRDLANHVSEDTIADEMAKIMQGSFSVPAGTVIPTGAGELERTHKVKQVFHAASVEGNGVGGGYRPINTVEACVTNALALADSADFRDKGLKSILFPLMGTGIAPGDLQQAAQRLFEAAVSYLRSNPSSTIEKIYFIAWSDVELETCRFVLESFADLKPPTSPSK
jgi:O-acetyl-ADP-ribose deacetylase (regulator of RNase III)